KYRRTSIRTRLTSRLIRHMETLRTPVTFMSGADPMYKRTPWARIGGEANWAVALRLGSLLGSFVVGLKRIKGRQTRLLLKGPHRMMACSSRSSLKENELWDLIRARKKVWLIMMQGKEGL